MPENEYTKAAAVWAARKLNIPSEWVEKVDFGVEVEWYSTLTGWSEESVVSVVYRKPDGKQVDTSFVLDVTPGEFVQEVLALVGTTYEPPYTGETAHGVDSEIVERYANQG